MAFSAFFNYNIGHATGFYAKQKQQHVRKNIKVNPNEVRPFCVNRTMQR